MRRAYLYQAKINKATQANAEKWLELCRYLYNAALEQRILYYKQGKKSLSAYSQNYQLPELKGAFPEFKEVNSQVLQEVIGKLDKAYQHFFRRVRNDENPGFPRFKGKNRFNSFTLRYTQGWKLEGRYLIISKVGRFKLYPIMAIKGQIKTITVRRSPTSKWFVSFSCDNVSAREYPEATKEVGIDVGIKFFCVDSEGKQTTNPKYLRLSEKLLKRKQRTLSRRKKGSIRRNKARIQVAIAHEKVGNQRKDFLHKLAREYVKDNKVICIEDLNIGGMVRNKRFSKSIADAGWGIFFRLLSEKAEEAGRQLIKVAPHNTSQICSSCGEKVPKTLAVRTHHCPFCGLVEDRDFNASLNIKRLGQSRQALTSAMAGVA